MPMRTPPLILVVDDVADNVEILQLRLESQGYEVIAAADGEAALAAIRDKLPDLVLLDIMMPKLDGIGAVKAMKADPGLPFIPVILVTARADAKDVVAGLEAGADDYLTKPVDQAALMARVRAMLRIKALHDTVQEQSRRLEDQAAELALWNRDLESRVQAQLGEIERMGTLKRFLAPQLAEMIVSRGEQRILETHRRDIVVVFCDLRGFTAFAETAEPEEVLDLLREYHEALGPLVTRSEGTLDHFSGDGIMVFFNDPLPCRRPGRARRRDGGGDARGGGGTAGRLAPARPRDRVWRRHRPGIRDPGPDRLCRAGRLHRDRHGVQPRRPAVRRRRRRADPCSKRIAGAVEGSVTLEEIGELTLKGLSQPVTAYNVT